MSQRPEISARRSVAVPRIRRRPVAVARALFRWLVVMLAAAIAVGHVADVHRTGEAAPPKQPSTPEFAMEPCRLGSTTARGGETVSVRITGANRSCPIPPTATRVTLVVTVANGTAGSALTASPGGAVHRSDMPATRWFPGQPPTSTEVTVELGPDGDIDLSHTTGSVLLMLDLVGYST